MRLPEPPAADGDDREFLKLRYEVELSEASARRQMDQKAALDAETALNKSVHDARLEVARAAIDRGQNGAEFVRNAAAAIGTLYAGVLGVTFSTAKDTTPLPPRGLAPAVFLGVALVAATAYAALLSKTPQAAAATPHSEPSVFQERRLNAFAEWVTKIAFDRVYFLHAAVISLGLGVLLLPAAFIAISDAVVFVIGGLGLVATIAVPRLTAR